MRRQRGLVLAAGLVALVAAGTGTGFAMGNGGSSGEVVCQGAALTFSAEGGAPGVTSNQFPVGTRLKITNLDNNKSTTVPVTGVSGSCALLNATAMEQVRQPGKNVIRNNRVEVVSSGSSNRNNGQNPNAGQNNNAGRNNSAGGSGQVVCQGSTVTLSGEGGAPAASSSQFPVGTRLKITNLDNNKSTTVSVTGISGSCALLNNAAFEQVREAGKFLIRRARIERVG